MPSAVQQQAAQLRVIPHLRGKRTPLWESLGRLLSRSQDHWALWLVLSARCLWRGHWGHWMMGWWDRLAR